MRSVEWASDGVADGVLADGGGAMIPVAVDEIDRLRAGHYDLIAALFGRAPTASTLADLSLLERDDSVLGRACGGLAAAAASAEIGAVKREFFALFVGVGRGELMPYASYYLTGFLNERPLARVREDLDRLGIERSDEMSEPEDHIAILMETMAGLASGRFEAEAGADRAFFERHLKPWAARFFGDVARNKTSALYRAAGALGRAFIEIEAEAYALDA